MTLASTITTALRRDVTYSVVSQIFVSGFNFAVGIAAARILGIADFGQFTLVLMISAVSTVALGHILTVPMMTFAGLRPRRNRAYFATVFRLGLVFSLFSGFAVAALLALIDILRGDHFEMNLLVAVVAVTFAQNQQIILRRSLFAERRRMTAVAVDVLRLVLMVVFGALALSHGVTVDVATLLYMLAGSAFLAALPFSIGLMRAPWRRRLFNVVLARHWPMSRWLLAMLLVSLGQEQALWVIVGIELGDEAVGGLRAGQYLLGVSHTIVMAMENHIPRNAAESLRNDGRAGLRGYLSEQSAKLGGTVIGILFVVALFAEPLLSAVFGPAYAVYAPISWIFAFSYAFIVVRSIWAHYLRAIENTRAIFLSHAVSSAVAIALVYPLMSQFGITGVAICIAIAQAICLCMVGAAVLRDTKRFAVHSPARPVPASKLADV